MKRIFPIFFIFYIHQALCQNTTEENSQKVLIEVYGKCFKNLKSIEGTKAILPIKKDTPFCSLYQCVSRIEYAENEKAIEEKIVKRAIEITTLLYHEGTPVYLMIGMGSFGEAEEKNQNLADDNKLFYISIAECISSLSLNKIQEAVNEQTLKLISKK